MSAVTIVLAVGLLRSYAVYGPIDWAIFNRFIGWLVLLAYFCTGALIVIVSGRVGFGALSRVLAAATVGLVAWELVHRFLAVGFDAAISDLPARAEAVAGNANAFAFQLLMAFAALVATTDFRHRKSLVPVALGGLLLAGLWLAGSRASVGALAAMVVAIPVLFRSTTDRPLYFRKLALATVIGASVLIIPDLAAALVNWGVGFGNIHAGLAADTADIQADRVESLRGGFAMWAQHPIFGAGLGAYVRDHIARTGIALVIHNSALWVAAEMGLVGLCAFGALFTVIGRAVWTQRAWARTDSHVLVVGCVVGFAVMSLAHDMLYQRPLWLLLGASLASPCAVRSLTNRKPRPAPAAVADPLIA